MSRHTPGPWSINDWPQANSDIAVGAVGTPLVARVPIRDVSIVSQKANARLIAAAPELLVALQMFDGVMCKCCNHPDTSEELNELNEAVVTARAAIAKATGVET